VSSRVSTYFFLDRIDRDFKSALQFLKNSTVGIAGIVLSNILFNSLSSELIIYYLDQNKNKSFYVKTLGSFKIRKCLHYKNVISFYLETLVKKQKKRTQK
jgi:hypothetical protein